MSQIHTRNLALATVVILVLVAILQPRPRYTFAAASYQRWIAVWEGSGFPQVNYPIEITSRSGAGFDHAALVAAGKSRADGNDLRVTVDGVEVSRWLDGPNTTHCKVWITMTLQQGTVTYATASAGPGDTTLKVAWTDGFPASGLVYTISGEAFTYTSKDATHFYGVTRGARGTMASPVSGADLMWWVEHDVYLTYGDPNASPPSVEDNYKPAFRLDTSTNTAWNYDEFGENDGLRAAPWTTQALRYYGLAYGGNHGSPANPWDELGLQVGFAAFQRYPGSTSRG